MSRRTRSPIEDLRLTIDCLPRRTREAMLEGVRANPVIVGGYTDGEGGICPMLAAHRHGGRTDFVSFARAWDRYTHAEPGRKRRATRREIRMLVAQLEASLLAEEPGELGGVIAEHQALARDRRAREAARTGLGWLRRREPAAPQREREREPA